MNSYGFSHTKTNFPQEMLPSGRVEIIPSSIFVDSVESFSLGLHFFLFLSESKKDQKVNIFIYINYFFSMRTSYIFLFDYFLKLMYIFHQTIRFVFIVESVTSSASCPFGSCFFNYLVELSEFFTT